MITDGTGQAYIFLPLTLMDSTRLRVPEWIASTVEMDLAGRLLVASHLRRYMRLASEYGSGRRILTRNDGDSRTIFGDQASCVPARRQHNDSTCILL